MLDNKTYTKRKERILNKFGQSVLNDPDWTILNGGLKASKAIDQLLLDVIGEDEAETVVIVKPDSIPVAELQIRTRNYLKHDLRTVVRGSNDT